MKIRDYYKLPVLLGSTSGSLGMRKTRDHFKLEKFPAGGAQMNLFIFFWPVNISNS